MQDDRKLAIWAIDQQIAANGVEIRRIQEDLLAKIFAGYKLIYGEALKMMEAGNSAEDVRRVLLEACQPVDSPEMLNHVNDALDDVTAGRLLRSEPVFGWLPLNVRPGSLDS